MVAVAVGYGGALLRTEDAGMTWTEISTGSETNFRGVDFGDAETGMVVGQDGFVLRTEDAGLTWIPVATGSTHDLWDIACIGPDQAVAVGEERTILRTVDGGATWQEVGVPHSFDYCQSVFFIDNLQGWTCTFYGYVFHTSDGGLTWESQASTFLDLQDIYFSDPLHGISVGGVDGNATILTDDGGGTWTQQANPEDAYLNGVQFCDPLTGIAVGEGIFRTFDGAATWQRDFSYSLYFEDICLLGDGVALAVGRGGGILRAGPDGVGLVSGGVPPSGITVRAFPNPFNPRTTVAFSLPRRGRVQIKVLDLSGRQVRALAAGHFPAGDHTVEWNGRDDAGRSLASGSYLIQCRTDFESRTQGVMLIR
jgi:hypothetical protein